MANNALDLTEKSEYELLSLVRAYELITKQQVNWRKNELQLIEMIRYCSSTQSGEVKKRFDKFYKSLNRHELLTMKSLGIYSRNTIKTTVYRGITTETH